MTGAGDDVRRRAEARARAMADGDAGALAAILHPDFHWSSHRGDRFDRGSYVAANCGGPTTWRRQDLEDPEVTVVGDTAVLHTVVTDEVVTSEGPGTFRMPMTQTWVRVDGEWLLLAGHAGPRLDA